MSITLYSYIAHNNPDGARSVITGFGYKILHAKNASDLSEALRQFINIEKEKGLDALAKIHPDRELILSTKEETASGADGTNSVIPVDQGSSALPNNNQRTEPTNYTPVLIAGMLVTGLFVSAAIIVTAKK